MPNYNRLEIKDIPADFFELIEYRFYLDSMEEFLDYHNEIPEPPKYVKYTPKLFYAWTEWAKDYKPEKGYRPFGETVGPQWMKTEFKGLEDFFSYYMEIINIPLTADEIIKE